MPGVYWTARGPMPRQPDTVSDSMSQARNAGMTGIALVTAPLTGGVPLLRTLTHGVMAHVTVDVLEHVVRHVRRVLIDWPIRHIRRHVLKVKVPMPVRIGGRQQGGGGGGGP
jgi:hypothetical protein